MSKSFRYRFREFRKNLGQDEYGNEYEYGTKDPFPKIVGIFALLLVVFFGSVVGISSWSYGILEERQAQGIITYGVDVAGLPQEYSESEFKSVISNSFSEWQRLNPQFNFIFIDIDSVSIWDRPDIIVEFDSDLEHSGIAEWNYDSDIISGTIVVNYDYYYDCKLPKTVQEGTMKHEIGHMLGINHSPDETNLMYGVGGWSQNAKYGFGLDYNDMGFTVPQQVTWRGCA